MKNREKVLIILQISLSLTYQWIEQKISEISLSIVGNRKFCNTENILPYRLARFTMQAKVRVANNSNFIHNLFHKINDKFK